MKSCGHPMLAALLGALLSTQFAACLPDRCKSESANIELTVDFSDIDTGRARRLEFETLVQTEDNNLQDGMPPYYEKRLGSIAWPGAPDGKRRFLLNTGNYLNHLPEEANDVVGFRIIIRVYGEQNTLLGEGQYFEKNISETGCYIEKSTRVTKEPTCRNKVEGDPCVSPDSSASRGVCMLEGGNLRCRASICGDGFTDRRGGETCDHADSEAPCTTNCLSSPVVASPSGDGTVIDVTSSSRGSWAGTKPGATTTFGYWSVGADPDQVDLAGAMLAADLDGDGVDELALGLPGGRSLEFPDCAQCLTENLDRKVGLVYLNDYAMVGGESYGDAEKGLLNLEGPYEQGRAHGFWFGAALAAGDVDGDGVSDLLVGAPHYDTDRSEAGGFYLLFGGPGGAIPTDPQPTHRPLSKTSESDYRLVVGEDGAYPGNDQPGDHLGYALAVADFDLDGIADIAAGAPHRKAAAATTTSKGEVYLIEGQPGLRPEVEAPTSIVDLHPRRLYVDAVAHVRLGVSLATGDVNGDGYPDLVVGTAPGNATSFHGGLAVQFGGPDFFEPGDVEVFPDTGGPDLVTIKAPEGSILEKLGGTVQVVDVNGDGYGDVAATLGRVGLDAPSEVPTVALIDGRFFVEQLETGSTGAQPGPAHLTLITGPRDAAFGAVLSALDVSGDHRRDLVISAPRESLGGLSEAGSVYALLSTPLGTWWDPEASQPHVLPISTWRHQTALDPVDVPLIWLQGATSGGQLGVALAASSHLSQFWDDPEVRYAYTYVLQPGVDPGSEPHAGKVHGLYLPAALPCEADYPCVDAAP
jgi:hypothetical protein